MTTKTTYTAICERVGKWWEITVPELESGRVTQARSLDDVEVTVRDLVVTMTGADPKSVEVDVRAPALAGSSLSDKVTRRLLRVGAGGVMVAAVRRMMHVDR